MNSKLCPRRPRCPPYPCPQLWLADDDDDDGAAAAPSGWFCVPILNREVGGQRMSVLKGGPHVKSGQRNRRVTWWDSFLEKGGTMGIWRTKMKRKSGESFHLPFIYAVISLATLLWRQCNHSPCVCGMPITCYRGMPTRLARDHREAQLRSEVDGQYQGFYYILKGFLEYS